MTIDNHWNPDETSEEMDQSSVQSFEHGYVYFFDWANHSIRLLLLLFSRTDRGINWLHLSILYPRLTDQKFKGLIWMPLSVSFSGVCNFNTPTWRITPVLDNDWVIVVDSCCVDLLSLEHTSQMGGGGGLKGCSEVVVGSCEGLPMEYGMLDISVPLL